MPRIRRLLPLLVLLGVAQNARADAVWQALFFEPRTLTHIWWVIPLGLLIEWPAVRKMTLFPWKMSLWITVVMNAVSFIAGTILQMPTMFMRGPGTLYAVFTITILGSTFIEGAVMNLYKKGSFTRKTFPLLLLVNILSGGITIGVVLRAAW